jgi:hypothetical protein
LGDGVLNIKVEELSLQVKLADPKQQVLITHILEDLKASFPIKQVQITVQDKKLMPFEIGLLIVIGFIANISSEVVIRLLDKLWGKLNQNKILPYVECVDRVQMRAEEYLKKIGISSFEITRKEDKGLYVLFIFEDIRGEIHYLYVSKTDLRVLNYIRRRD